MANTGGTTRQRQDKTSNVVETDCERKLNMDGKHRDSLLTVAAGYSSIVREKLKYFERLYNLSFNQLFKRAVN